MSETIQITITDEIRLYCKAEAHLAEVEGHAKECREILATCEQRVILAMLDAEVSRITVDGRTYTPDTRIHLKPLKDDAMGLDFTDRVVKWIATNGGGDLVVPTMHWAKRNKFLEETCIDDDGVVNLPEELDGLVEVVELPSLGKRRAG